MKKHLLLLLFLTATLSTLAQTPTTRKYSRWTFSLLGGPAFPVGGYYGMNKLYPHAGPVHTGGVAEFSADYWVNRYLAVTLLAGGQLNSGKGFPYAMSEVNELVYHPNVQNGPTYSGGSWKIGRLMPGVTLAYPVNKKQNLDVLIRLLGGVQWTRSANYYSVSGVDLPRAFCGQTDAGIRWRRGKHLALIAYAGYVGSSVKHDMVYYIGEGVMYSDITVSKSSAHFSTSSFLLRTGIQYGW